MGIRRRLVTGISLCVLWMSVVSVQPSVAQVAVQVTGDSSRRLDILVMGDGYTGAELPKFATDVSQFMTGVFLEQPFREYQNYFNVWRIDTASAESGADHPERTPPVTRNTAFDASYNCSGIQRLVCVSQPKVLTAASAVAPSQRDLIVVLVNDPEYGGAGGSVAVASTNAQAVELILHETGHTLAFLADEYTTQPPACADTVEPPQVNATKDTNRSTIKWRAWIESTTAIPTTTPGVPGLYLGSRYCPNTLYRPTYDSKMRSLNRPYEQINTEQFVRRFYDFASPVESRSPASASVGLTQGQQQQFSITTPQPATHSLSVTWQLNGQNVAAGPTYILAAGNLDAGTHTLTATASDPTPMVRNDPSGVLAEQVSWTVTVNAGGPLPYTLPASGGTATSTVGAGGLIVGHAVTQQSAGSQSGLAVFRYLSGNVTVTEAAVPASAKLSSGRIYAEIEAGANTGIAISNPGSTDALISFYLTDVGGNNTPADTFTLPARTQIAKFLNEDPFGAPNGFVGTFTFSASVPVAAIALRTLLNERGESLFTTLPVVDLAAPAPDGAVVFPHFASGQAWKTSLLLVNPSDLPLSGFLVFRDAASGLPLTLTVDGQTASSFSYDVAPRASRRLSVTGGAAAQSGSVLLTPSAGQPAPVGLVVFSYRPANVTISEAGVPTVPPNSAFLLYAEALGSFGQPNSIQPGLALANTSPNPLTVTLELRNLQGVFLAEGTVVVPGNGQRAAFLNEIQGFNGITGASPPYQGRLRVSAPSPNLSMMGLLGRYNERREFLMTTTPSVPESAVGPAELVFPHFVDGEGFTTKFILLNNQSQQSASGTLLFYSQAGQQIFPGLK